MEQGYKVYRDERPKTPTKTLRDEFAMAALTGLLGHPMTVLGQEKAVERAYDYADAMLKEKAKRDAND